jgi:hypothetical protein
MVGLGGLEPPTSPLSVVTKPSYDRVQRFAIMLILCVNSRDSQHSPLATTYDVGEDPSITINESLTGKYGLNSAVHTQIHDRSLPRLLDIYGLSTDGALSAFSNKSVSLAEPRKRVGDFRFLE